MVLVLALCTNYILHEFRDLSANLSDKNNL